MTELEGRGLLVLLNDIEHRWRREYEIWHSREHVPERLSVPGMTSARRYVRLDGSLPKHLTLYAMRDLSVLDGAPYQKLLNTPTDWSRRMRPAFRNVRRMGGTRITTRGGGMGGLLVAMTLDDMRFFDAPDALRALEELPRLPGFTAMHLVRADPSVAKVPFTLGGKLPDGDLAGMILIESCDNTLLIEALPSLASTLTAYAPDAVSSLTTYALAMALSACGLDRLTPPGLIRVNSGETGTKDDIRQ